MDAKETIKFLVEKYKIDLNQPSPFNIDCGRYYEIPKLFTQLGFKKGAEIGVYRASYSRNLLKRIVGLQNLLGVDAWELYKGYHDFDKINDIQDAHREAKEIAEEYGDRFTIIQGWSIEVAKTIPDESLDFVFIDANHAFEFVVADIAAWAPKVRKGGIIYGHDFDDYSHRTSRCYFMNVVNAVEGWTKSNKIHPWFILKGNKHKCWMYIRQ